MEKYIKCDITRRCNYSCEYCIQSKGRNKKNNSKELDASDEVIDGLIKFLSNTNEKFNVRLMGGEIFVHPRVFDVINCILKNEHNLNITTNFSFPLSTYQKIFDMNEKKCKIFLSLSLHLSQTTPDKFLSKLKELDSIINKYDNCYYDVQSVVLENNLDDLKQIDKILNSEFGKNIHYQNLRENGENVYYDEKTENSIKAVKIKDQGFSKKKDIRWKNINGTTCSAGLKFFIIKIDGKVKRCYEDQRGLDNIGNIKNPDKIKLLTRPYPCLGYKCNCPLPEELGLVNLGNRNYLDIIYCKIRYVFLFYTQKYIQRKIYGLKKRLRLK